MPLTDPSLADALHDVIRPLDGGRDDLDPLIDMIGDARFVLIGEASHGTHDFYKMRANLTRRLVRERNFNAVAVEADWPDAYRINRYVRGMGDGVETAEESLGGFKRFPQWMWRNADVLDFVGWLRDWNDARGDGRGAKTGFYGIDLYSLNSSIRAVLDYLDKVDPEAAERARYRYACFEDMGEDPQAYGYTAAFNLGPSCEDAVIQQLVELRKKAGEYVPPGDPVKEDEHFYAEQNARLVLNAERYYRSMFEGRVSSWNLRDRHMAGMLDALVSHLDKHVPGGRTKVVVWAHNSHLGDARATEVGQQGELNVGQLVRQRWGKDAVNVGFSTYEGTVTAASRWDGPAELKRVRPGLPGSYEALFHDVGVARFMLLPRRDATPAVLETLRELRLQRAIGVIYAPQTERVSHYFHARLADQFDAMIHLDHTRAVQPLERAAVVSEEVPETYPSGV